MIEPNPELQATVEEAFVRHRIELPPETVAAFTRYLELIEHWNATTNLTAVRERGKAIERHLVEPCLARNNLDGAGPHIVDAGSGVGVPGIPLAILDPDRDYQLVEANTKRATFLEEVKDSLGLDHVEVIHARIEEAVEQELLNLPVHILASRGWTSGWGELLGIMAPLMAPGGRAILWTGEQTERQLRRYLSRGEQAPLSSNPEWAAAADAGWTLRRARPLRHLQGRGFIVSLEIPAR